MEEVLQSLIDISPILALLVLVVIYQQRRIDKGHDREIEVLRETLPLLRAVDAGYDRLEKKIDKLLERGKA